MSKVLIIRLSSLGDVAMLVPVVASVAAKYPQDRFSVMTRVAFAPLFQDLGFNINVVPVDVSGRHRGILGLFRIMRRVFTLGFSHVADEHDVLRSKVIRWLLMLTGRKVIHIDKGRKEKKELIESKVLYPPLTPTIERYREVFNKLGFPAEMTFTNFFAFTPRKFSDIEFITGEKKKENGLV